MQPFLLKDSHDQVSLDGMLRMANVLYNHCVPPETHSWFIHSVEMFSHFFPLSCLEGLAVDWIHDKLFWTDSLKGTVEVAGLEGSVHAVLYSGLNFPRGIAVDPFKG